MLIMRRRPTPITAAQKETPDEEEGVKKMRKVWLAGRPEPSIGGNYATDPYWFVEATSNLNARAFVARALRKKKDDFTTA